MACRYLNAEGRSVDGRSGKICDLRVQCTIKEDIVTLQVPVDNLVRVDVEKGTGKLLAPLESLLETDLVLGFPYVWKNALKTRKLKSNPGLEWLNVLKKALVSPILCKALIDFSFNLNVPYVKLRKRGFYDSIGGGI